MKSNGFTNKKTRLKFARNDLNKPAQLGEKFFRRKKPRRKETAHDPNHNTASV